MTTNTYTVTEEICECFNDYALAITVTFDEEGFDERQQKVEKQKQLSKEFVREWLIANNFMGKEGQSIPEMNDEWVNTISGRYIELYEKVTGKAFVPTTFSEEEIMTATTASFAKFCTD
jgi:phosphoribosylaminoimidazole-succinocarboxamide synthase